MKITAHFLSLPASLCGSCVINQHNNENNLCDWTLLEVLPVLVYCYFLVWPQCENPKARSVPGCRRTDLHMTSSAWEHTVGAAGIMSLGWMVKGLSNTDTLRHSTQCKGLGDRSKIYAYKRMPGMTGEDFHCAKNIFTQMLLPAKHFPAKWENCIYISPPKGGCIFHCTVSCGLGTA